jgi:hypothetical protein
LVRLVHKALREFLESKAHKESSDQLELKETKAFREYKDHSGLRET